MVCFDRFAKFILVPDEGPMGVRAKHAARQILQSRLNRTEDRIALRFAAGA